MLRKKKKKKGEDDIVRKSTIQIYRARKFQAAERASSETSLCLACSQKHR